MITINGVKLGIIQFFEEFLCDFSCWFCLVLLVLVPYIVRNIITCPDDHIDIELVYNVFVTLSAIYLIIFSRVLRGTSHVACVPQY